MVTVILAATTVCPATNLVTNGGFETATAIPSDYPTDYGYWARDFCAYALATDGISPLEGSQMIKFVYTQPGSMGPLVDRKTSELHQLIDISGYADLIAAGNAHATGAASFNRVAGDAQTDTLFRMVVRAFAGAPSTYPSQATAFTELAKASSEVFSDSDILTWEQLTFDMPIPVNTDFISVLIYAGEDVFDDGVGGIEFDGHYADAVSLEIVPEPATLSLCVVGTILTVRRRRPNKN